VTDTVTTYDPNRSHRVYLHTDTRPAYRPPVALLDRRAGYHCHVLIYGVTFAGLPMPARLNYV
jgi:hypothetical protein